MKINRIVAVGNENYRHKWVSEKIAWAAQQFPCGELLDVGAGLSPYKEIVQHEKLIYKSHDFSGYEPSSSAAGLQDKSWCYPQHHFVCDILVIPNEASAEIILCTEVLEHVPDAVRAFQQLAHLTKPEGVLIVTVPFLSLMHQSPFWFQSGLSPFWFEEWCKKNKMEIVELTVQGDFIDLMSQEVFRLFSFSHRTRIFGTIAGKLIQKM